MKSKQTIAEETKDWDAFTIDVDGTITQVTPENGEDFTLEELYKHTDCECVQCIPIDSMPNRTVWCDDDGMMNDKPVNQQATVFLMGDVFMPPQGILGKVLICDNDMVQ